MTILLIPLAAPADGRRLLRSARLIKSTDLPANKNAHYVFRFGVMRGTSFTPLSTFDGRTNRLEAGVPFPLTGERNIDRPLLDGDVLALEASMSGMAPSISDATVEWTTTFRTALAGADVDQNLAQFFARSGVLDRVESRTLGGLFLPAPFTASSYDSGSTATTAGAAYINGPVSATLYIPLNQAFCAFAMTSTDADTSGGGGTVFLSLGTTQNDTTTDRNEAAITTFATGALHLSTHYAARFSHSVTFRSRIKSTTNNGAFARNVLSVLAVPA